MIIRKVYYHTKLEIELVLRNTCNKYCVLSFIFSKTAVAILSNLDQSILRQTQHVCSEKGSVLLFSGIGLRYNFSCHRKYYVEPFIYNMEHTYMDMVHYMIG